MSKNVILIEPFEVPQELEKQGYTGKVITNKLIDKLKFILITAGIEMKSIQFTPTWSEPQIRLEIPGGGISLKSIILYIKKFFGQESTHISGEVVIKDNQIYTTLRISGKSSETIPPGELKVLETEILLKAAEHIYKSERPSILAYYLYLHKKEEKRSLDTIQYVLSQEPPDDDSWALNLWGVILRKQNDYKGALDKHKRAIGIDPENASAYNSLGNVFLRQGKCELAIVNYKKAIKIDPTFAFAYTNWGNALVDKEDYKGAIENLQKAITIELEPVVSSILRIFSLFLYFL